MVVGIVIRHYYSYFLSESQSYHAIRQHLIVHFRERQDCKFTNENQGSEAVVTALYANPTYTRRWTLILDPNAPRVPRLLTTAQSERHSAGEINVHIAAWSSRDVLGTLPTELGPRRLSCQGAPRP